MTSARWPRWLRGLLAVALGLVVLAMAGFVWLFFLGGIAISDRAMLWRMLRESGVEPPPPAVVSRQLQLPAGFRVAIWAQDLPSARLMTPVDNGDLILSQPRGGLVVLLLADGDGDGRSDGRKTLFANLDRPNGVDLHDGWLYVAEATRVSRVRFDAAARAVRGELQPLVTGLTADGAHWRKTARIGPDGMLYVGQGSTCNVCVEADPRRATMMRFAATGGAGEIIATGTRNPYGFDWAPWDGTLYATENSRDLLGDDLPPDELNRIVPGGFYGWPYVHGRDVIDPEYGADNAETIARALPPAHAFRAHNAPLGIRFLRHASRPAGFERAALVALHGSWNRSTPDGYKVVSLHFGADGRIEERPFLDGFRGANGLIGRPVDVVEGADGSIFVSDDYAGVVYRVSR